ncbi:MAG: hypothetical protein ACOCWO_02530 [Candidatus Muiribacteriaceae bacterium]
MSQALEKIDELDNDEARNFAGFVRASERGIIFKKY